MIARHALADQSSLWRSARVSRAARAFGTASRRRRPPNEEVASTKTAGVFAARAGEADVEAARRILRREGGQSPEPEDRRE